jgi:hypothetical protein
MTEKGYSPKIYGFNSFPDLKVGAIDNQIINYISLNFCHSYYNLSETFKI